MVGGSLVRADGALGSALRNQAQVPRVSVGYRNLRKKLRNDRQSNTKVEVRALSEN